MTQEIVNINIKCPKCNRVSDYVYVSLATVIAVGTAQCIIKGPTDTIEVDNVIVENPEDKEEVFIVEANCPVCNYCLVSVRDELLVTKQLLSMINRNKIFTHSGVH